MDRQSVIATLKEHQAELERQGVRHAALFGSVARGDAGPNSDIDIMIDLDPEARLGVYDYVGLKAYIAGLFDGPVDVVSREGLKPYVKPAALTDALYVFKGHRPRAGGRRPQHRVGASVHRRDEL